MTVFEQELQKLFGEDKVLSDVRIVGNACYGRLDEDVRVKLRFMTGGIASQYDRLKVTLLNRREGEIDSLVLKFRDVWGMKQTSNPNFQSGVLPHLWDDGGEVGWYVYKPDRTDYRKLSEAVDSYLAVFLEPVHAPCHGQRMG